MFSFPVPRCSRVDKDYNSVPIRTETTETPRICQRLCQRYPGCLATLYEMGMGTCQLLGSLAVNPGLDSRNHTSTVQFCGE